MMNMYSRPRFSCADEVDRPAVEPPPWSPNCSTAVGLALMPELVLDADAPGTSLRAPSEPSALTRNFGTMNRLMPFTPSGAPVDPRQHEVDDVLGHVVLAVGDEDLGAEEPVACRRGCGSARVRTSARSEPACGSVRFIVPVHSPEIIFGMKRCLLLGACRRSSSASIAPSVSSGQSAKLRLALLIISMQAAPIVFGRPWPPNSAGCCSPCQPPSRELAERLLEARRRRHHAVLPTTTGAMSPSTIERRDHVLVEARALLEHGLRGVEAGVLEAGQRGDRLEIGQLLHAEQHVLDGCDVAHGVPPQRRQRKGPSADDRATGRRLRRRAQSALTSSGTAVNRSGLEAVVGDAEDRRLRVLVDRDDDLRVLHAGQVLDRAADAGGDVELRRDDLAGLADLPVVRRVAGVDGGAAGAERRAELVGERRQHLVELVARAQRAPAGDDDLGRR